MIFKYGFRFLVFYFFIILPLSYNTNSATIIKFENIVAELDSPEKVWKYLKEFEYQLDRSITIEPSIKSPQEFLNDKKGDCKDFSNFAFRVGQNNNINCRVYAIYPKPMATGHAICIWKINNKYYPLCNVTASRKNLIVFNKLDDAWKWYVNVFKWKDLSYVQRVYPTSFCLIPMIDSCIIITEQF